MFKKIAVSILFPIALMSGMANAGGDIVHKKVTVAATNDEWTPTGIKTSLGDILIVVERGNQIKVGSYLGHVDANGAKPGGEGALYIKVGVMAGEKIGAKGLFIVSEPGAVKLKVRDSVYSDNAGSFVVDVIQIPGSMIPPAALQDVE